jgi:hypothetical protein
VIQVAEGLVEQRCDVRVEQAIDHLAPISISGDQPEISQYSQLVRNRRLLHPNLHAEVTNRTLAGA